MRNPLKELARFGQSPWYDNIRRSLITSGELARMIREDGLRGLTSNPTIFEKAIAGSTDYDVALKSLVKRKTKEPEKIVEELAAEDISQAADLFMPLYEESKGADGFVSLEVSPTLAHDTEGTVHEARRLAALLNRPNLMIKVPATKEGLPAIERLIGEGISVNVTLIFSIERYEAVAEAYLRGLEELVSSGKPVSKVASVASFFVSRIDAAVDKQLQETLARAQDTGERALAELLLGKIAIANAKLAYQKFKDIFSSSRFKALQDKGARFQRVLWASTGTKSPQYSDVMYIEELIGPDTVNTIPPATWEAFRHHGKVRASLEEAPEKALEAFSRLKKAGMDLDSITAKLEEEGVKSFMDSFSSLLQCVRAKTEMIVAGASRKPSASLGSFEPQVRRVLETLEKEKAAQRIWSKDASLWKKEASHQAVIKNSMGWLALPEMMADVAQDLVAFAEEIRREGFSHVLLLGMGGSSLAPEVFRRTFPRRKGFPELLVLDSTDPEAIRQAESATTPKKTLYIVSSKSGTTTEPLRLFDYFYARTQNAAGASSGKQFVAITDPGTPLEKLARGKGLRRTFLNPQDIGGRYSALSYFGLVPAALMGIDITQLLDRAARILHGCASCVPAVDQPGLWLGAVLGALAKSGKDKFTFLCSPEIESLGLWLEQLLAESTGKEGKGVIPISGEPLQAIQKYGKDRAFIYLRLEGSKDSTLDGLSRDLEKEGHAVVRVPLESSLDLGAEFYRWELATAVLGYILEINPFDQPNVQQAKDLTKNLLDRLVKEGSLPILQKHAAEDGMAFTFSRSSWAALELKGQDLDPTQAMARFLSEVKAGDYVALLPYLAPTGGYEKELQNLRGALIGLTRSAVQMGYGPRYLHSTGQLHKGGPNSGMFLILCREDYPELPIPGSKYTFGQLIAAQAWGDFQALDASGRRALFIRFQGKPKEALQKISRMAKGVSELASRI